MDVEMLLCLAQQQHLHHHHHHYHENIDRYLATIKIISTID